MIRPSALMHRILAFVRFGYPNVDNGPGFPSDSLYAISELPWSEKGSTPAGTDGPAHVRSENYPFPSLKPDMPGGKSEMRRVLVVRVRLGGRRLLATTGRLDTQSR